jgi:hypothetical protein
VSSPTQRSLKYLRDQGFLVAIVEHWNHFANIRQDLFGFADILAVHPGRGITLAVQTTSGSNVSARRTKLTACANVATCLKAGWLIHVHGWAKRKVKRGGKAYRYELRTVEIEQRTL